MFGLIWLYTKLQLTNMSETGQQVYCGGGVESNFSVIFGPNLNTNTLLRPRPKLNNIRK